MWLLSFLSLLPCLPHAVMLIYHEGLLHSRTKSQNKSFSTSCLEHGIYDSNRRVAQHSRRLFISDCHRAPPTDSLWSFVLIAQPHSSFQALWHLLCRLRGYMISEHCMPWAWLLFISIPGWPQYQICVSDFQTYNSSLSFIFRLIYLTTDLIPSWMSNKYFKSMWPKLNLT